MKKILLISMMICVTLSACHDGKSVPTVFPPSKTPSPISTITLTPTLVPPTKTLVPTLTLTPLPPYPTKQVLFDYYVTGDHSVYDFFFDPYSFHSWSNLVLYADGQIIISGKTYKQKILTPGEIEQFLSKLESMGFYSLESNQKHDPTDKLYDYGNNYQESYDGRDYCISVKTDRPRELCVYEPDFQYLIPKMKNILQYLDEYQPTGMTPYDPDRILLWVQPGRDPNEENLPETTLPWPNDLPLLSASDPIAYVDGEAAKKIDMLFDSTNVGKVFTQDGKEYTLHFYIVLPHENLTNAYQ